MCNGRSRYAARTPLIRQAVAVSTAAELAAVGRRLAPGQVLDARLARAAAPASAKPTPNAPAADSSAAESKAPTFHRVLLALPDRVQAWLQNLPMTAFLR